MPTDTAPMQNTGTKENHPGFTVISIGDLVADLVVTIPRLPVEANAHQLARHVRLEPGGAGNFLIAGRRLSVVRTEHPTQRRQQRKDRVVAGCMRVFTR